MDFTLIYLSVTTCGISGLFIWEIRDNNTSRRIGSPTGGFASGNGLGEASRGEKRRFRGPSDRFGGRGDTLTSAASRRWLGWQTVGTRHIGDALDDSAASRLIRSRIARYSRHETATSAIWNVTYLACRTTLAPILINFSRKVVIVHVFIELTIGDQTRITRDGSTVELQLDPIVKFDP